MTAEFAQERISIEAGGDAANAEQALGASLDRLGRITGRRALADDLRGANTRFVVDASTANAQALAEPLAQASAAAERDAQHAERSARRASSAGLVPGAVLAVLGVVGLILLGSLWTRLLGRTVGRVRSGAEHEDLVGLGGRLGLAHVHGDDVGAAPAGRGHVARGVRLAGQVGAPEDDEIGVGAHVLLGARLQQAREAKTEAAQSPADHLRAPRLAAVEIGEAADEVAGEPHAVVVGGDAVARPRGHRLPAGHAHPFGDPVEHLVPAGAPPVADAAPVAHHGMEQPRRVVDDLP